MKRPAAAVVSVLLLGSTLQVSGPVTPAQAGPGQPKTWCKTASGRALVLDSRGRTIGQLIQELTFCWKYYGEPSIGTEISSAKVKSVTMGMTPDRKPCALAVTRTDLAWRKTYFKGLKTKVFRSTVQGTYKRHAFADTAPRDCKNYKWASTDLYLPEVTIWGHVGGKVKVIAPPVTRQ
jgi:hypothetical protein